MKKNRFEPRVFWESDASGATPPAAPPAAPAVPATPPVPTLRPEAEPGFEKLLQRYGGNSDAVSTLLYRDNYDLRQQIGEANKKVPVEGAIVLTGDEANNYQAYLATLTDLNLKPDDIKTEILSKRQYERDAQLAEVATVADWNLEALKAVQGIDTLKFEIKEEADPADANIKVKKVFTLDAEGKEIPLDQLPTIAPLLPALQKQATPPAPTGVQFVRQPGPGALPAATDRVQAFLQQQEAYSAATPNPLMPQAAVLPVGPPPNALGGR